MKFLLIASLLSMFGLAGCNTVDGMEEDFEEASQEVEEAL